jgi:hypothetical protein
MIRKRPTALDRKIADAIRHLEIGEYIVTVLDTDKLAFTSLVRLKSEGMVEISLCGKIIKISKRT